MVMLNLLQKLLNTNKVLTETSTNYGMLIEKCVEGASNGNQLCVVVTSETVNARQN